MASQSGDLPLEKVFALASGPARVFAAFSDPDELAKWFGPQGFSVGSVDLDPHVGGTYRIEMQPPEGEPFYLGGEFREVEAPGRLAFTFTYEDPDPDDVETLVELSFRDRGGSTEIVLTQRPFKTEARRELHRVGWTDSFDRLAQVISRRSDAGDPQSGTTS
jgi:uncharacterized protein YndB with AHSA1/START domain